MPYYLKEVTMRRFKLVVASSEDELSVKLEEAINTLKEKEPTFHWWDYSINYSVTSALARDGYEVTRLAALIIWMVG